MKLIRLGSFSFVCRLGHQISGSPQGGPRYFCFSRRLSSFLRSPSFDSKNRKNSQCQTQTPTKRTKSQTSGPKISHASKGCSGSFSRRQWVDTQSSLVSSWLPFLLLALVARGSRQILEVLGQSVWRSTLALERSKSRPRTICYLRSLEILFFGLFIVVEEVLSSVDYRGVVGSVCRFVPSLGGHKCF